MATKIESQKRVNEVYALLNSGKHRHQIIEIISEKYGISGKMVDKYIQKANEIGVKSSEEYINHARSRAIGVYYRQIDRLESNSEIGDIAKTDQIRKLQERLDKITGIESQTVNFSGNMKIEPFVIKMNGNLIESE